MGKLTISMGHFNSYVKLPEGNWDQWLTHYNHGIMVVNMVLCWYDVYDDGGHWPQPSQLVIAP